MSSTILTARSSATPTTGARAGLLGGAGPAACGPAGAGGGDLLPQRGSRPKECAP